MKQTFSLMVKCEDVNEQDSLVNSVRMPSHFTISTIPAYE